MWRYSSLWKFNGTSPNNGRVVRFCRVRSCLPSSWTSATEIVNRIHVDVPVIASFAMSSEKSWRTTANARKSSRKEILPKYENKPLNSTDHAYRLHLSRLLAHLLFITCTLWPYFHYCSVNENTRRGMAPVPYRVVSCWVQCKRSIYHCSHALCIPVCSCLWCYSRIPLC